MKRERKGYIHIYTGDGKGKTTAAIGLIIRALGAGCRVLLLQFMKQDNYSEHRVLSQLSPNLEVAAYGKPYFLVPGDKAMAAGPSLLEGQTIIYTPGHPPAEYVALIGRGLSVARQALISYSHDLVVLDELTVALNHGLADLSETLSMLKQRHESTEVVITGRDAPGELIDLADLVTEMREVKHYYHQGVFARPGIEK